MWKWLVILTIATPAYANPKRTVDASVTFKRTIEDSSTETDPRDTACVSTKKTTATFSEVAQVVASKLAINGTSFSLPDARPAKLSGQAHYDWKGEQHSSSCGGTSDFTGTAQADADAKDIAVSGDSDSVSISPHFGDPKAAGTTVDAPKKGATTKHDSSALAHAQGSFYSGGMGIVNLWTAEPLATMAKADPHFVDMAKFLAQDKPVVVQLDGNNIDITYTDSQTLDLTKYDTPAQPGVKKSGTRKVVTEVSIHLTPAK